MNVNRLPALAMLLLLLGMSGAAAQNSGGGGAVTGTPCGSRPQGSGVGGIGAPPDGPCSNDPPALAPARPVDASALNGAAPVLRPRPRLHRRRHPHAPAR